MHVEDIFSAACTWHTPSLQLGNSGSRSSKLSTWRGGPVGRLGAWPEGGEGRGQRAVRGVTGGR